VVVAGAIAVVKAADESHDEASLFSPFVALALVLEFGTVKAGFFGRRKVIVDGAIGGFGR